MSKSKPFLAWVGGKRKLIDKLIQYTLSNFNNYYEPFLGVVHYFLTSLINATMLIYLILILI